MSECMNAVSRQAATIALMIKVAECDGHVHTNEIAVINGYVSKNNINEKEVMRFKDQSVRELKRIIGDSLLNEHMNIINELVVSDGIIHKNESEILKEIRQKNF